MPLQEEEVEREVKRQDLADQQQDLQHQHADHQANEGKEVEHGKGGQQEDDQSYDQHAEVELEDREVVLVDSVPLDVELLAVEEPDHGLQKPKDVVVDVGHDRVQEEHVARAGEQHVVGDCEDRGRPDDPDVGQVGDDEVLDLDESSGCVVPDVDEVQDEVADELGQVRVGLEAAR